MKNKNVLINDFTDYQLYKLPMLKDDEYIHHSNTYLIGIIDASGSMLSIWSQVVKFWNSLCLTLERTSESKLAVTFDHKKKFTEYDLTENISEWGGGQTNIMGAFSLLEKVIDDKLYDDSNYFDKFDSASIIFISDGEDSSSTEDVVNKMKYLNKFTCFKTINFITIGIGHEFPTFLAMDLRIFYHNGINEIPPLYLIENDDDFDKIKSSIVNLLVHEQKKKLVVSPKSLFIPWEPLKEEFLEGDLILSNTKDGLFKIEDKEVKLNHAINSNNINLLFQLWVYNLHLLSLKKDENNKLIYTSQQIKDMSKVTLKAMNYLFDIFQQKMFPKSIKSAKKSDNPKVSELLDSKTDKKTFYERIVKLKTKENNSFIFNFINEVKALSEGGTISNLSANDAAKRLAIGTQTGKFNEKAMKMKGYTIERFINDRDKFINTLSNSTIKFTELQDPSVISMQNQKEILTEGDLIEGINMCDSQYDLILNFPLIGNSIYIKRSQASLIDPWSIVIKDIAKFNKIIDSISLLNTKKKNENGDDEDYITDSSQLKTFNEIKISVGDGDVEVINGVLPIFDDADFDLLPFIKSNVFNLLMTFNVMQNVDSLFENSYQALLANSIFYLLQEPDSEWKTNILVKTIKTMKLACGYQNNYIKYMETLLNMPREAVVTESVNISTRCEDLSKPIAYLAIWLYENNSLGKVIKDQEILTKFDQIYDAIVLEYFGRMVSHGDNQFSNYFKIENPEVLSGFKFSFHDEIRKKYLSVDKEKEREYFLKFFHENGLKKDLKKSIEELSKFDLNDGKTIVNIKEIFNNLKFQLKDESFRTDIYKGLTNFETIYKNSTGKDYDKSKYLIFIYHSTEYKNSYNRYNNPIEFNTDKIIGSLVKKEIRANLEKTKLKKTEELFEEIDKIYIEKLRELHFKVYPISKREIEEYIPSVHGIDPKNKKEIKTILDKYKFTKDSKLIVNACSSKDCPFFLRFTEGLDQHIGKATMPALHKTVALHFTKSSEELFNHIINFDFVMKDRTIIFSQYDEIKAEMIQNKHKYLKYIAELSDSYIHFNNH